MAVRNIGMQQEEKNYLLLVLLHIAIGVVIFYVPFSSKIYGYAIVLLGLIYVLATRNRSNEVLYVCAYIVGSEVVLRMTEGNILYEFSKYGVIIFILIGMLYRGFSKDAIPYWIFLLLLIPGVLVGVYGLDYTADVRKTISFNISGPVCLGISALYMYKRYVTVEQISKILLTIGLPVITCTVYMIFYTPSIRDVVTGTSSNFETSGGFGPNQVSTILGLGMFVFFSRMIFMSKTRLIFIVNLILAMIISYRGIVTFSRGGMITGIVMLIIFFFLSYIQADFRSKFRLNLLLIVMAGLMTAVWAYSSVETGGLINKRYANKNAIGKTQESRLSGRENIIASDIGFFMQNPILGIGVARGAEMRNELTGRGTLSHNEISRMLAEHGVFGIVGLLILFITPLVLYVNNKANIYLICFICFWLLTINHAAMRLAAPAFIYALSLLKVFPNEADFIHRK